MKNFLGKKQQGSGTLMIWSFIHWDGRGDLLFLDGGIDGALYKNILRRYVLPHCENIPAETGEPQLFMDDGASSHNANDVIEYCAQLGIQRPYWPPNSPDMNPIEWVWGWLKQHLTNLDPVPANMDEVKIAVKNFYGMIDYESIKRLMNSMTDRVSALLKARGGNTEY